METLLALMLMSSPAPVSPKYTVGSCYGFDSEDRPNTIKILGIDEKKYRYQVWNNNTFGPADEYFLNSFESIETVYDHKKKCPNE
jgi:hypothetical protein